MSGTKDTAEDAVGIARVSGKDQEDGYSLDSQEKLMHAYTDSHRMRLIKVFKIAESASKSKQRKIFRQAMKFIEEHGIKHLVVEKVDRHARNFHDAVETHDWLMRCAKSTSLKTVSPYIKTLGHRNGSTGAFAL